ncbi:NAD(P)-dependent oxidoreductase [Mucilaginibacter sp.]|uniref:NAD(P)-dependent oxidoreductase n=1 Tax=Mucilaginibacter sp. TaxID=1882438 RepID=UPI003D0EEDDA
MSTTKIGWIGLGNMGIPMSQQLIKAGYTLSVYNRNKEKEAPLISAGATTAASPAMLIQQVDIVIIMVSDDDAIDAVFNSNDGLLSAKTNGKLIINMSTVSPAISKKMAQLCEQQGNFYLDAPVSGSVKQAEDGLLVIMAGGNEKAFEQAKPVLEKMGKLVMHIGDTGTGNTAKLVINTLLSIHAQALAEAIVFAQQNGLKATDLLTLVNNSALASPFIKIKGDAIINDNYKAVFALKHIAKDLRLAKDIGMASPLGDAAFETYQQAEATLGNEDIIAVIKQVRPE